MPSSTSHSNRGWPRLAVRLGAMALMTLGLCAAYTLGFNPEIRFYRSALEVKQRWLAQLRIDGPGVVVAAGGSSCAFSIDGERMRERHGLRVANFGLHAGMEPPFLTAAATAGLGSGDTLVLALEPGLLVVPFTSPDLAAQMGFAVGHPEWIQATPITGERTRWLKALLGLRPGAQHFFTLLGKWVAGRPLYRYQPEDLSRSGWQQTRVAEFIPERVGEGAEGPERLSPDARRLLEAVVAWAGTHQVDVVYSLPWARVPQEREGKARRANARFLQDVLDYMPVLRDPALGAQTQAALFSDSDLHLTAAGAARRTDELAEQLQARRFWTRAELVELGRPVPSQQ